MRPMKPSARHTIRLLLVDDHPLVRDGLRARLDAVQGLRVVAEASDADTALEAAATEAPDLVLMDVTMRSAVNGLEATRRLLLANPGLKVLILSMHDNPQYVREAHRAGACGYLLKDSPAEEIVDAIRAVMATTTTATAADNVTSPVLVGLMATLAVRRTPRDEQDALTPREREVLELIAEGLSSRDIGERLLMGVRTVETHRTSLRRKLELPSPAALVRYAVERRWRDG
jgi:two-component system, NarL family, nitrate/nitrite response regulator NarL